CVEHLGARTGPVLVGGRIRSDPNTSRERRAPARVIAAGQFALQIERCSAASERGVRGGNRMPVNHRSATAELRGGGAGKSYLDRSDISRGADGERGVIAGAT